MCDIYRNWKPKEWKKWNLTLKERAKMLSIDEIKKKETKLPVDKFMGY